jgi:putative DNA primase/helicase
VRPGDIIAGDLCLRVITATLNPGVEQPELREFRGDPVATVMADRGKYIAAALTVCRAYAAAGRPNPRQAARVVWWMELMWCGRR